MGEGTYGALGQPQYPTLFFMAAAHAGRVLLFLFSDAGPSTGFVMRSVAEKKKKVSSSLAQMFDLPLVKRMSF